jgi:hypothetical protein
MHLGTQGGSPEPYLVGRSETISESTAFATAPKTIQLFLGMGPRSGYALIVGDEFNLISFRVMEIHRTPVHLRVYLFIDSEAQPFEPSLLGWVILQVDLEGDVMEHRLLVIRNSSLVAIVEGIEERK